MLERALAVAHPVMPFVTEEIWSYLPDREAPLIVSPFPAADEALVDEAAEAEMGAAIDTVRDVRRWRDLVGVAAGSVLDARQLGAAEQPELVGRLARLRFGDGDGEALTTVGEVEILASGEIDAELARERIAERRRVLESEVERAERKLGNDGFVAKAPEDVVAAEREKLDIYRRELEELGA